MSTAAGAGMIAHAVHYAVVLGGLIGLAKLLAPHALDRLRAAPQPVHGTHEERVRQLRELAEAGRLTAAGQPMTGATLTAVRPTHATSGPAQATLAVALVSSTAAAGVHAAVGPAHLTDQPLIGIFFLTCAAGQLGWTALVLVRPSRRLLETAVVGNVALLALWATSRLVGAEPVGPWDLAAALWEVAVVAGCVALLHPAGRARPSARIEWPVLAQGWTACSVLLLAVLSLSGASA